MANAKQVKHAPEALSKEVDLRIIVGLNDPAPFHYVNFMEVANTVNDFSLLCVRLPPKLSDDKFKSVSANKELHVEPEVVITFPTSMVPGLIRALTTQMEAYEKMAGSAIQEPGKVRNE